MIRLLLFWLTIVATTFCQHLNNTFEYEISHKWNGEKAALKDHIYISVSSIAGSKDVVVKVTAPFYDDPVPDAKAGENSNQLYTSEVVEVYFLNNDDLYLQIQLGPHGHHNAILFDGERNLVRNKLPLENDFLLSSSKWSANVKIPGQYLPQHVTKFNAAAMHGEKSKREHFMLYPGDKTTVLPNFHDLKRFKPIALHLEGDRNNQIMSDVWKNALNREVQFTITKTWENFDLPESDQTKVRLQKTQNGDALLASISAPFYNDPVPELNSNYKESPTFGIFEREVAEVYFANDDDQYLQIGVTPRGEYMVLLFNGIRNVLNRTLPLNVTSSNEGMVWNAQIIIPKAYFPPNPTTFSASSTHGIGPFFERFYTTLSPSQVPQDAPNLHNLPYFKKLDIRSFVQTTTKKLSPIWFNAIQNEFKYTIRNEWNGNFIPEAEQIKVSLKWVPGTKDVKVIFDAPFHNDPRRTPSNKYIFEDLFMDEVVEVYFSNIQKQYVQAQLTTSGEYLALLFNGERNFIRRQLPLETSVKFSKDKSRWLAEIIIPGEYLPSQVNRFSASSMHRVGNARRYITTSPQNINLVEPNFHNTRNYKYINLQNLHPSLGNNPISKLWQSALEGEFYFQIEKTWNGFPLKRDEKVDIFMKKDEQTNDVLLRIESPFYNDSLPNTKTKPFDRKCLSANEVIEVYFLNPNNYYTQIQISPTGDYDVIFFNGLLNKIQSNLNLNDIKTTVDGKRWIAELIIPAGYLPPKVRKFSASAMHGEGNNRKFFTLTPLSGNTDKPNFHNLGDYVSLDMRKNEWISKEDDSHISPVWQAALKGNLLLTLGLTYDGKKIEPTEEIRFLLSAIPESASIRVQIDAPFHNYTAPDDKPEYKEFKVQFRNDEDRYLQITVGPYGLAHALLAVHLNGNNQHIKDSLSLNVTTDIGASKWTTIFDIPADYFPPKVTKFNAFAIHGPAEQNTYLALYPPGRALDGSTLPKTFDQISSFRRINMAILNPKTFAISQQSPIWVSAFKELNIYR